MTGFWIVLLLAAGLVLLGRFGLPEKRLPPPPTPRPERIMDRAGPWRFEGDSGVAFLVVHGFGGTPFNVQPLGEFLHSLGHSAIGVLLPGHGTSIEDMNAARFEHWEEYVERRYLEERARYRKLFLVGFSMGGAICLKIAARNADAFRPTGILTISSPVFFNGFYNGKFVLHQPATMLSGILKIARPTLRFAHKRHASLERLNPWIGYQYELSVPALHSFKCAMPAVRRGLGRISSPYCNIMAANDRTVSAENQAYIHNRINSREKRAYMFILPPDLSTMHTLLTHERARERVFRYIETFVEETLEDHDRRRRQAEEPEPRGLLSFFSRKPPRRRRRTPDDLIGLNKN